MKFTLTVASNGWIVSTKDHDPRLIVFNDFPLFVEWLRAFTNAAKPGDDPRQPGVDWNQPYKGLGNV